MGENKTIAGRIPDHEYKLDVYSVLSDIMSQWISVLLLTASVTMLAYIGLSIRYRPAYRATATVAIENINEDTNLNNIGQTELFAAFNTAGDSAAQLQSIVTMEGIRALAAQELGKDDLEGSISASTLGEGNLLEVYVTSGSPEVSLLEEEAVIKSLSESGNELMGGVVITVVEEPRIFETPINARPGKIAIAVGILVFFAICTLLSWRSSARYTVRNSMEVAPKLETELLAVIPKERKLFNNKSEILITDPSVSAGYSEEVRSLAIRLMNEMEKKGEKTLLVFGALEDEGKSTLAANIALALSQMNRKVVLADMDFSKPSLAQILNMKDAQFTDFAQYLAGGASADPASAAVKIPGTELSALLVSSSAPQTIYQCRAQIRECLGRLREEADFVIVDSTPMNSMSAAEELAMMTEASILVVRENFASVADIVNAVQALGEGSHMLGCALNNARGSDITADAARHGKGGHYVG